LSINVVEHRERISLRASWSSLGVAIDKYVRSDCAYGWEETSTPFNNCFPFSSSDKYFHTMYIILDIKMKCLCL